MEKHHETVTPPELSPGLVPQAPLEDVTPTSVDRRVVEPSFTDPDTVAEDAAPTSERPRPDTPESHRPDERRPRLNPAKAPVVPDKKSVGIAEPPTTPDLLVEAAPSVDSTTAGKPAPTPANPTVARPAPTAQIWPTPVAPTRPRLTTVEDPPIRVHIGRLDVRANLESPIEKTKTLAARRTESESELTLNGYLRGERTAR